MWVMTTSAKFSRIDVNAMIWYFEWMGVKLNGVYIGKMCSWQYNNAELEFWEDNTVKSNLTIQFQHRIILGNSCQKYKSARNY